MVGGSARDWADVLRPRRVVRARRGSSWRPWLPVSFAAARRAVLVGRRFGPVPPGGWVVVAGSRCLGGARCGVGLAAAQAAVGRVLGWARRQGAGVAVGCAGGADRLARRGAQAAGLRALVFCAGASAADAPVSSLVPWAGGGPALPAAARLARRSLAMVQFARRSGCCRGVFVLFAGYVSPGSVLTVKAAVQAGLPVCCWGLPADQLAGLLLPGSWAPVAGWPGFFRFQPAARVLPLGGAGRRPAPALAGTRP